jgi:hypothetical protein
MIASAAASILHGSKNARESISRKKIASPEYALLYVPMYIDISFTRRDYSI